MGMLLNRLVKRDSTRPNQLAATMPLYWPVNYQWLTCARNNDHTNQQQQAAQDGVMSLKVLQ